MTEITTGATTAVSTLAPELTVVDGQVTTTSLQIAQHFGKRHDTVLRATRNLVAQLVGDPLRNFAEGYYTLPETGDQQHTLYQITKDGFSLLAMGFTGNEALQWKLAYIAEFNRREAALSAQSLTITPAQAQHLSELVDLVVESGRQKTHAETWKRFQRKMNVNSHKLLPPAQFDAAVDYLRTKMDDTSIAAIAAKHFPQLALPAPSAQAPVLDLNAVCTMITGGFFSEEAVRNLAFASNQFKFKAACVTANAHKGYGDDVASKITAAMSWEDLNKINIAASMEVWFRCEKPQTQPSTQIDVALRHVHAGHPRNEIAA